MSDATHSVGARHEPGLERFIVEGVSDESERASACCSAKWEDYFSSGAAVYRCAVRLVPEKEHLVSVYVPSLPGTASQGETVEEALRNIQEALVGAIQAYKELGAPIPWSDATDPEEPGEIERWITVHAP